MLSAAVRRGDLLYPTTIEDTFNRIDSSDLGRTSTGYMPWTNLRGNWRILNNRIYVPTSNRDPIAIVDSRMSDVEVSLGVSTRSGDGIVFRAVDENNYLRLSYHYRTTKSTTFTTTWSYICITAPVKVYPTSQWHSHDRICTNSVQESCCDRGVSVGTMHTHPNAVEPPGGNHGDELAIGQGSTTSATGTSTSYTRRIYLERVQNGVVSTLDFWNIGSSARRVWAVANGDLISVYRGISPVLVGTFTTDFNQDATKHGVGRRSGGVQGTSMDNFRIAPAADFEA